MHSRLTQKLKPWQSAPTRQKRATSETCHRIQVQPTRSVRLSVSLSRATRTLTTSATHSQRKRIGRGIGSGKGGRATRGQKGQKARAGNGKPKAHFEGGQTPLTMRYPKRGFTNPCAAFFFPLTLNWRKTETPPPGTCRSKQNLVPLNLERLQHWIDRGLIDPSRPITMRELFETRCIHGIHDGVKLLGDVRFPFLPSAGSSPAP